MILNFTNCLYAISVELYKIGFQIYKFAKYMCIKKNIYSYMNYLGLSYSYQIMTDVFLFSTC